jgi:5-methylcytosine-specific restriction protein B
MNKETIDEIVKKFQPIIDSEEFYFQKGQDALNEWLNLEIPLDLQDRITTISDKYEKLQLEAEKYPPIKNILDLLFQIISYCDVKAKDKIKYNKYPDKRTLAEAAVRMNHWIEKLIQYKFFRYDVPNGSIRHAFDYLLDPENQSTILSKKHRELISKNLLNRDPEPTTFVSDLKKYFSSFNLKVKNPANYTYLLSGIIYNIEDEWKEEVVGLMASDGTGWQDGFIDELKEFDAVIVWNSKRPSGKGKTLELLKEIVDDGKTFNLYYCSAGLVKYKATIIDFVDSQELLDKCKWPQRFKKIMNYEDKFENYKDDTKRANIVFLTQAIEHISPIPVSEFKFYNGYEAPRQDNLSPIKSEPIGQFVADKSKTLSSMTGNNVSKVQLNQILYGPPGTGKTFNSISHALAILESKSIESILKEDRKDVKARFDKFLHEGRVVFTTFHQSMSYEDFIEGIKPQTLNERVIYEIEDGIFKAFCNKARFINGNFDVVIEKFKTAISEADGKQPLRITAQGTTFDIIYRGTNVFYVQPLNTTKENPWYPVNIENIRKAFETDSFDKIYNPTYVREVINHLKKNYGLVKGNALPASAKENYVFIIDEINRGNVSQIFGELITLIESDKREDRAESIEVQLPYSKELFSVPDNVYILGTMNTADRSVEALDTALRRRFSFEFMPSKPALIKEPAELQSKGLSLQKLLITINERIKYLVDEDHQIGHSYFMEVNNESDLRYAFKNKILPLLKEYFYNDYGKIRLVLGDAFVKTESSKPKFAVADEEMERDTFKIITIDDNFDITNALIQTIKGGA